MKEAMQVGIRSERGHSIGLCAIALLVCCSGAARADDASAWRDIETKYIFGFTTGSGIGLEGEKEFTVDTIARFGKRGGGLREQSRRQGRAIRVEQANRVMPDGE